MSLTNEKKQIKLDHNNIDKMDEFKNNELSELKNKYLIEIKNLNDKLLKKNEEC